MFNKFARVFFQYKNLKYKTQRKTVGLYAEYYILIIIQN
jgi:hypothetical protein